MEGGILMRVLILSGSPRRHGNSDLLCDEFMRGAIDAGHEVLKVFLRDKQINYCMACDGCRGNGGRCVIKDDMADILTQMILSDVIVMASPVYFYSMDAQMKTLIDRTVAKYIKIIDKDFYFIVTAADSNPQALKPTVEGFRGFIDCLEGAKEKGVLYGTGVWQKGDALKTDLMIQAYEMGKSS